MTSDDTRQTGAAEHPEDDELMKAQSEKQRREIMKAPSEERRPELMDPGHDVDREA